MTVPARVPVATLRTLVAGVVDYAGLFPPAALPMDAAVTAFAEYASSREAWMLGRFVVPATRLEEVVAQSERHSVRRTHPWRLSALIGDDVGGDLLALHRHEVERGAYVVVDSVEARASTPDTIREVAHGLRTRGTPSPNTSDVALYVEVPIIEEPRSLLEAVKDAGARAKVRTGGVKRDAFPSTMQLARFVARCAELDLPFKATAGLHHPLRGEHRLTYAEDAPISTMFGFVSMFLAAAFARDGMAEPELGQLLEERDAKAITFDDDVVRWRGHTLSIAQLQRARDGFALSFGSCSFREPIEDLQALALL